MPRPSLKDVRTEELLDAFMRCVARYGLDGSTLERISKEANVGRPLLRHYLGNREKMVELLINHVMNKFFEKTKKLFADLPAQNRVSTLLDVLFSGDTHEADNAAVYQALVAASDRYEGMPKKLIGFVTDFERAITRELALEHPVADLAKCGIVAAGITAVYFNHDAALPLEPTTSWRRKQKAVALTLLESLS
ncbi:MAG: TetR/AcrR family transcriptional regulator [Rhizobiaceae bacterium]